MRKSPDRPFVILTNLSQLLVSHPLFSLSFAIIASLRFFSMIVALRRAYINRQALIFFRNLFRFIHQKLKQLFFFLLPMSQLSSDPELKSSAEENPPPFDPIQPSIPISYPIKTLQDLESRSYFESFHYPFNKASVPLHSGSSSSLPSRPRLLVCHDMAGGYGDDKWVQGGTNPDAYAIWHWYLIDVFVYFSHSLVTLPPPCWTNTAHQHGVKVLGTFITEWEEGKLVCNELLSTKESCQMYAERLTELAVALGFDGWLINMEVNLELEQIPNMKTFVSHLTQTMHSSLPGSLVIWYDSVTIDGKLDWQDQLNEKNKDFFDICDGIFLNYTWKESYPKLSAAVAGDRKFDVYTGIDVFGRNTFGGGQWNTSSALDLPKKEDVSAAIFAPGWVYETKQPPDFQTAQNHWWSLVEKSWGITQKYPKALPFFSNFNQGRGDHFSSDGGQILDAPWCNIACQSFQPFLDFNLGSSSNTVQALVDLKEASYSGGGNITFKGNLDNNAHFTIKLFQSELLLGDSPLFFTFSVKSESSCLLGLSLDILSTVDERKSVLLAPKEMNELGSKFNEVIATHQLENTGSPSGWVIQESSILINGYELRGINAVCFRSKPQFGELNEELKSDDNDTTSTQDPSEYYAVLGHISIRTSEQKSYFPSASSWLVEGEDVKWSTDSENSKTISAKITWKLKNGNYSDFPYYNIYVEKVDSSKPGGKKDFLGVARTKAFYVANHTVPSGTSSFKFIIQVCSVDGSSQKLEESPFFHLDAKLDNSLVSF